MSLRALLDRQIGRLGALDAPGHDEWRAEHGTLDLIARCASPPRDTLRAWQPIIPAIGPTLFYRHVVVLVAVSRLAGIDGAGTAGFAALDTSLSTGAATFGAYLFCHLGVSLSSQRGRCCFPSSLT